jgi:predicted RNA-binding protein with PIN domain
MFLIDGNNLIGHSKEISYHDPQARQKLLERVIPFLGDRGSKAIIFFDGGSQSLRKSRNIEIVFSGPKSSADEKIRQFVETSSLPKSLCVVTSDNSVYGYCRSCGARAMKCHEFNRLLRESQRTQNGKENREIQIDDLQQWLRYFGENEE